MLSHDPRIAVVGLGQLGTLLADRLPADRLLLVSRDAAKAQRFAASRPGAESGTFERLGEADILLLALPADEVAPFYRSALAETVREDAVLVNTATKLETDRLRESFPRHTWLPMKLLGSVKAAQGGRPCLLVTDTEASVARLAPSVTRLGRLIAGDERWALVCNTIATRHALEAALRIDEELRAAGLPPETIPVAQAAVASGVLQSYADGTLGHFGKSVLAELQRGG